MYCSCWGKLLLQKFLRSVLIYKGHLIWRMLLVIMTSDTLFSLMGWIPSHKWHFRHPCSFITVHFWPVEKHFSLLPATTQLLSWIITWQNIYDLNKDVTAQVHAFWVPVLYVTEVPNLYESRVWFNFIIELALVHVPVTANGYILVKDIIRHRTPIHSPCWPTNKENRKSYRKEQETLKE